MYNKILRPLYILIFEKLLGWKIQGHKPEIKKFVVIVAPHTSNWDFMVGEWARSSLRMKGWYIGKKEIFVWPFGYLFRALGGFPVDRNKSTNLVDQIVAIFNSRDEFNITFAPEGTRAYNPNWKTGFYSIAQKAGIPILMVAFDYSKRLVVINELFYPTGNLTNDLIIIKDFFKPFKGKFPDQGVL
jgi:1-acyl-sn-glycerol-3-phosphate acyltransferase